MTCLSPVWVVNPRWRKEANLAACYPTSCPPDYHIKVPCGRCYNCLKKRSSDWRVRLLHEVKYTKYRTCNWVTLTIASEYYERFRYDPAKAIRLFLDRLRKKVGHSVRHWFVTELGEENDRLHFHGFVFDIPFSYATFRECWSYGFVWIDCVSNRRISYACKYSMKLRPDCPDYFPKVFVSPGLGKAYTEDPFSIFYHVRDLVQNDRYYVNLDYGVYASLPRYYRDKIFSEERRKARIRYLELHPPEFKVKIDGIIYTDPRQAQFAALEWNAKAFALGASSRKPFI